MPFSGVCWDVRARSAPVRCRRLGHSPLLVRERAPLIRTRDDLLELIAHALRLQLSYLSKNQALVAEYDMVLISMGILPLVP